MKTAKNLIQNIQGNKEILKGINKLNHYDVDSFVRDAKRYIKAIQEHRMVCNIESVSRSGMSRNLRFVSMEQYKHTKGQPKQFGLNNYFAFFIALGYTKTGDSFRIGGCGMDMVFHTNYSIIHVLHRLGFINKEECSKLSQMTPSVI